MVSHGQKVGDTIAKHKGRGNTRQAASSLRGRPKDDLERELKRLQNAAKSGALPRAYRSKPGALDARINALKAAIGAYSTGVISRRAR